MNVDFFQNNSLFDATNRLFQELGIRLNSNTSEPLDYEAVLKQYAKDTVGFKAIEATYFSGLIDDSVFAQLSFFKTGYNLSEALVEVDKTYEGLMLFSLELNKKPTRTEISELTRAFNRISQKMPIALLLKYSFENAPHISIAISERFKYQQSWRQGEKTGKIIILRDINTIDPHSGHLRILKDLIKPVGVTTFAQLHHQWLDVLDVSVLNKKFFNDLANWYLYSQDFVKFPNDLKIEEEKHIQINLIRLITRLIFVWFLKEKGLVQEALFEPSLIKKWLKSFDPNGETSKTYYPAILQNLFFATLNQRMKERDFIVEGSFSENKEQYGVKTLYRYASSFKISEGEIKALFQDIPFLNGGLFDCLDKEDEETKKVVYVDGFSRNSRKVPTVPDFLFFSDECTVDLTEKYGYRKNKEKFCGIIEIFKSYKFTIEENTPIEEEIALDPELLGKVFENLLAYYNPETETTARKQTGSFYTPREIVNYMVDESLIAYLKKEMLTVNPAYLEFGKTQTQLFANEARKGQLSFVENLNHRRWQERQDELENELRRLVHYNTDLHRFTEDEVQQLIFAIDHCKILDPACGSGAFPMGILHKLVYILSKLDPENKRWRELQQKKAEIEVHKALSEKDKEQREKKLVEINDAFEHNSSDYGRKLYLIENCIYGVDIQTIAVQISKLRFFISLIVDQKERKNADNRGIRPLPNLETKFVAADTLVRLEKPKQLGLVPTELDVLETKLEQIRHRHFEAKTRKEKLQCQKEDKAVRKKIAELLKSTGWHKEDADKIAGFDIYDQNLSAEWFDPEWMFGKDALFFDIVIGNPPYLIISKLSYDGLYRRFYSLQEGKPDLYRIFIERSFMLLKKNGIASYITPNTFLTIPSAKLIRRYLIENTSLLTVVNYDQSVFESASVNNVVYVIQKVKPQMNDVFKAIDLIKDGRLEDVKPKFILQSKSKKNDKYEINIFSDEIIDEVIHELLSSSKLLGTIEDIYITLGLQPYHNTIHTSEQMSSRFLHSNSKKNKNYIIELGGKDVKKYSVQSHDDYYLDYSADLYNKPDFYFFEGERLIVREIVSDTLIVGYTNDALLFNKSCYIIKSESSLFSNKFLLGLLNSKVIGFYVKNTGDKSKQLLFPRITMRTLKSLPLKSTAYHQLFEIISSYLIYISETMQNGSIYAFFERLMDVMVYEIYFEKQIKNAGCEVLKFLKNISPIEDDWDNSKKRKEIEKTYKELSNPSHIIGSSLLKIINIEEVSVIEGRK